MFVHVLFFPLTGFGTTILPQLWRDSPDLVAEIKPWLSLPGFQFCITLSCAKGLFLMKGRWFIKFTMNTVFSICLCIQEGYNLCSFIALQNISLMKSAIQNMRLNCYLQSFMCNRTHEFLISSCLYMFSLHTEAISVWWAQSWLRAGGREEDSSPAKHQNGVDRCPAVKNIISHNV